MDDQNNNSGKDLRNSNQREIQERIELKKLQEAAAEHKDVQKMFPKEEKIVPKTFHDKWKNYWYHYKALTWASVFMVFLAGWMIKDIFFGPKYDLAITTATRYNFAALNQQLDEDMSKYLALDYNGDGRINVTSNDIMLTVDIDADVNPQENAMNLQKLMAIFASGKDLMFIMDQPVYDMIVESNGNELFVNFEELYAGKELDCVKGNKVILNDTALGHRMFLHKIEQQMGKRDEVFICVRAFAGNVEEDNRKNRQTQEVCLDFVENLLRETYPDQFEKSIGKQ